MKHDDRCEAQMGYVIPRACRCDVRALEARLARLRPVVAAAAAWAEASGSAPLVAAALARNKAVDAARALTPADIEWAKGGE